MVDTGTDWIQTAKQKIYRHNKTQRNMIAWKQALAQHKESWKKYVELINVIQLWLRYLYTNTVLDGSVIRSVWSSNFETKHIFGILMTLRKLLKLWGAAGAPIFFPLSFTAAEGGGFQNGRRRRPKVATGAPLPRRAGEIPPKAGISRVYL